ncbi:MAG: oxidoreductase [bacterium]
MNFIDAWLNKTTMYRVVLYSLLGFLVAAVVLSIFDQIPYGPIALSTSASFLVTTCWITNFAIAKFFKAPMNVESAYITALILLFILEPASTPLGFAVLFWAGVVAMASKYLFAIGNKHLFNPVIIAVIFTGLAMNQPANWWIGIPLMLPFIMVGGLLIVWKIRRSDLAFSFLFTTLLVTFIFGIIANTDMIMLAKQVLLQSAIWFFAFVMLTEPLTTPPTVTLQVLYGGLVGLLFVPQLHIAGYAFTPETALLAGNIFSYLVSPKQKLILTLKKKTEIAPMVFDYAFSSAKPLDFKPGQYLEWTLGHSSPDSRGNRRYFTIASSPTEKEIHLGVKFYDQSSSFKRALKAMAPGDTLVAGQLAGDFVLPKNASEPCVFIAGGIGITPFRSMIKYLIDKKESRKITLFYATKTAEEIAYKNIFDEAERALKIKTIYATNCIIDPKMISEAVLNCQNCTYYISGPHGMVHAYEKTLHDMGIAKSKIKSDFFPGFV